MNVLKRAILYIARKWKKTLLIFFLLCAIGTLVLSGLAISDAQKEQSAELRGTTGTSFTVSRNTATGGWGNSGGGSYSTQEFLSNKMLEDIGGIDGIEGYNASIRTILCLADGNSKWLEQLNPIGHIEVDRQFYSYGCINSEYNSHFLSGALVLSDGSHIGTNSENGIIISAEMADKHKLCVGDTIRAVNDPFSNDKTMELQIVGLFDIVADKTDQRNNYNEESYYDYANYSFVSEAAMRELLENYADVGYASADFFVSDPEQLEPIIQEAQSIDTINWNNFIVTANDEVYERVASSVSSISSLISTLIIITVIVSMVVIVLILSMWMRSRKKEIGILLAIGTPKAAILAQYVFEMLFVTVVAFPTAYLCSNTVADTLGKLFDAAAENIVITPQHFMLVAIVGVVLVIAAVILSCIPVMRYKPKELLSQME